MENPKLVPSPLTLEVFASFVSNSTLLCLPLTLVDNELQAQKAIPFKGPNSSFQQSLNQLEDVLSPQKSLYLLLRRESSLIAITYIPYLTSATQQAAYLHHRHGLLHQLGASHFASTLICKEIGEITDARSWDERDAHIDSPHETTLEENPPSTKESPAQSQTMQDLGYKKNKCRLCDRRMKNKIDDAALAALSHLDSAGACVQMSLHPETSTLTLTLSTTLPACALASHIPSSRPSFTFYRHAETQLLYFIFCSPDCATVRERMVHTMALPGLVNVHARDAGVCVDRRLEVHGADEVVFGEDEVAKGRWRSLYLGEVRGTEGWYEGLEGDRKFWDKVV